MKAFSPLFSPSIFLVSRVICAHGQRLSACLSPCLIVSPSQGLPFKYVSSVAASRQLFFSIPGVIAVLNFRLTSRASRERNLSFGCHSFERVVNPHASTADRLATGTDSHNLLSCHTPLHVATPLPPSQTSVGLRQRAQRGQRCWMRVGGWQLRRQLPRALPAPCAGAPAPPLRYPKATHSP